VAEDVSQSSAPAAVAPSPAAETLVGRRERRSDKARRSSYRFRFGLVYILLAAMFGAGVGAFVVLASRPEPEPDPTWSAWQPTGSPTARLRQIADRIPKAYKEDGQQLTVSTAGGLSVPLGDAEVPIKTVFVEPDTSRGLAEEGDIKAFEGATVASFALCGVGTNNQCALRAASASTDRSLLLQRQAIELSLYTLKYIEGVDSVLVFMPPTAKGEGNGAVFLTRSDVAAELDRPITEILPSRTPTLGSLSEIEEGHVLRLTDERTFSFQFEPAPDGSPVLILTPPTAAPA
jgi:hypothetical protein